jgi:hypothetical protein
VPDPHLDVGDRGRPIASGDRDRAFRGPAFHDRDVGGGDTTARVTVSVNQAARVASVPLPATRIRYVPGAVLAPVWTVIAESSKVAVVPAGSPLALNVTGWEVFTATVTASPAVTVAGTRGVIGGDPVDARHDGADRGVIAGSP